MDIDTREPEHRGVRRFPGGSGRGSGLMKEAAASREFFLTGAVGQETEVADTDETVGDDVEQEATNELLRLQVENFDPVLVGIVLPAEVDAPVFETEEALVGEGHPVGIAAQVVEDLLGSGATGAWHRPPSADPTIGRGKRPLRGYTCTRMSCPSTFTGKQAIWRLGLVRQRPELTSYSKACQGQVITSPPKTPSPSGPPRWGQ